MSNSRPQSGITKQKKLDSHEETRSISRRQVLGGALAAATAAGLGLGPEPVGASANPWIVAAGASGTTNPYHNDSWFPGKATDIWNSTIANDPVAIYAREHTTTNYGYYWCTHLEDSCEALLNPNQKRIRFDIGTTSSPSSKFGACAFIHVFPYSVWIGKTAVAYAQIATVGSGTVHAGNDCYTGPHLHQSANGTLMWPGTPHSPASAGNTAYWYWWV